MSEYHEPGVEDSRRWSPVWLIPVIALAIAAWLGWKAWDDRGVIIKVKFVNGAGIEAGRTPVRYKGLEVGKVESVTMNSDLEGITARIQMHKEMAPWLTKKTVFWLVHPEISMAGVSGLDTLLSGNYITLKPGTGTMIRMFQALEDSPPLAEGKLGLHIKLKSEDARSLVPGSPVYYRRIPVGEVEDVALASKGHMVRIDVYIKPEYADLVKTNTRFWNISGVHISGAISGLQVQTDSLLSILKGGIAFSTPEWETGHKAAFQGESFSLYSDYDSARSGIPVQIEFPLGADIVQEGSRVMFHGIEAGRVKSYTIKSDLTGFIVSASMDPQTRSALVDGAAFWLVEPKISPKGIEGMDALFSGRYIAMDVTLESIRKGQQARDFTGSMLRPPIAIDTPGLHLKLYTDALDGVSEGSDVWFRGLTIGTVNEVKLSPEEHSVKIEITIHIQPEFESLIREGVRFWKTAGFNVTGSLAGFEFNSLPLDSMISGGISCEVPDAKAKIVSNGSRMNLFPNKAEALRRGRKVQLISADLGSIRTGNPVSYRGVQVGEVIASRLADPADRVEIELNIEELYAPLVTEGSRFWNTSGVSINVNLLRGLQIRTASMLSLIEGGIAFATPSCDGPASNDASFLLHIEPESEWLNWNPPIELKIKAQAELLPADR